MSCRVFHYPNGLGASISSSTAHCSVTNNQIIVQHIAITPQRIVELVSNATRSDGVDGDGRYDGVWRVATVASISLQWRFFNFRSLFMYRFAMTTSRNFTRTYFRCSSSCGVCVLMWCTGEYECVYVLCVSVRVCV